MVDLFVFQFMVIVTRTVKRLTQIVYVFHHYFPQFLGQNKRLNLTIAMVLSEFNRLQHKAVHVPGTNISLLNTFCYVRHCTCVSVENDIHQLLKVHKALGHLGAKDLAVALGSEFYFLVNLPNFTHRHRTAL